MANRYRTKAFNCGHNELKIIEPIKFENDTQLAEAKMAV
jgi:hypothetical protein